MGEWRYSSISYLSGHWIEVVGQLHASAALPRGKTSAMPVIPPHPVGDCVESGGFVAVCVCVCVCVCIHVYRPVKGKGKVISLQARCGPEGGYRYSSSLP